MVQKTVSMLKLGIARKLSAFDTDIVAAIISGSNPQPAQCIYDRAGKFFEIGKVLIII